MTADTTPIPAEAEILKALEAGPTSEPWHVTTEDDRVTGSVGSNPLTNDIALTWSEGAAKADARYIAACHPGNMRAVMAELQRLRQDEKDAARLEFLLRRLPGSALRSIGVDVASGGLHWGRIAIDAAMEKDRP